MAGYWLARRLHQLKASTTMDLGISKLGLVGQNVFERDLSVLLLRTLAVGGSNRLESIKVAPPGTK